MKTTIYFSSKVLFSILLLVTIFSQNICGQTEPDRAALEALYNSTDGANWTNNTNWLSSEPISKWFGITVIDDRVNRIDLLQNNLTGPIPKEIGNLSNLTVLNAPFNQISGSIPSEISNLTNLTLLHLNKNQLTGVIPTGIGNLTNLQDLYLDDNQLIGSIPLEIWNLTKLTVLGLSYNQLTGGIPPDVGKLKNLTHLFLSNNPLTGEIPPQIGNLTNLNTLLLENNQLTGTIPIEIGNVTTLYYLDISKNQLSGAIPHEIGNLTRLQSLILNNNQLTGEIPQEIGNLRQLYGLHLCYNQLSGLIPEEIGNLTELGSLLLNSNQLEGSMPDAIIYLTKLNTLLLSDNYIEGLPNLPIVSDIVRVQNNHLTFEDLEPNINLNIIYYPQERIGQEQNITHNIGEDYTLSISCGGTYNQYQWYKNDQIIPSAINSTFLLPNLQYADGGSYVCAITNTVVTDLTIYSRPINLTVVKVNIERVLDSLALVALYNSTDGANWTNNTNWLSSEPISAWYGVAINNERVTELILFQNGLDGILPQEIGNLTNLIYLNLGGNQLSGAIPPELNNLTNLGRLKINNNKFDALPTLTFSQLSELTIQNNRFTFEDIEPNINVAKMSFSYSPQDSFGEERNESGRVGKSYTISVDCGGNYNHYQWKKDYVNIPGATSRTYQFTNLKPKDKGSYTCTVTNTLITDLILNSRPIHLSVITNPHILVTLSETSLMDITEKTEASINVYPNPTNGLIKVSFIPYLSGEATLSVYDNYGKLVFNTNLKNINNQEIDLSHLARGIYLLQIINSQIIYIKKLVIN